MFACIPTRIAYWSPELCFVNVPIKGEKRETLHLIDEELGIALSAERKNSALPLGAGDQAVRRLFSVSRADTNTDNPWNVSNLQACEQAKTFWVQATSRKDENVEAYKVDFARDNEAFPEPKWPQQSLDELIDVTFHGRMIDRETIPPCCA